MPAARVGGVDDDSPAAQPGRSIPILVGAAPPRGAGGKRRRRLVPGALSGSWVRWRGDQEEEAAPGPRPEEQKVLLRVCMCRGRGWREAGKHTKLGRRPRCSVGGSWTQAVTEPLWWPCRSHCILERKGHVSTCFIS